MDVTRDTRPQYSIGVVARRTGLTTHVLRAWERRYGVVAPGRSDGGVRLYSGEDILRLRLLRRVTEAGHSIGQVAPLSTNQLLMLVRADELSEEGGPEVGEEPGEAYEEHIELILEAVEGMDAGRIQGMLMRACVTVGAWAFIEGVAIPTLQQIGELWREDELCPAHEHLFSVQLRRVLTWMMESLPVPDDRPGVIATTPSGQMHELGAMLAGVAVAVEGWRVAYVGPDLPPADIATAVEVTRSRLVLLSVMRSPEDGGLIPAIQALRKALRPEVGIVVGGAAAAGQGDALERVGATYLPDLGSLRPMLRELKASDPGRLARRPSARVARA